MKVFLSWSGDRSRRLAETLRDWLPLVLQTLRPWLSGSDIDKGVRWADEMTKELSETGVGILCLTRENLTSKWIHFEAGALSKALDGSFVCTLLLDISTSDLSPPLSFFQATRVTREDITKLVGTLHRASASRTGVTPSLSADQLREVVGVWWPRLEQALIAIPDSTEVSGPVREDREILEEILEAVRAVRKTSAESAGVRIARARLAELETVKRQESALAEAAERDLGNCLTRLSALQHELAEAENVGTPDMAHLREVIRREDEQRIMWESRLRQARNRQAEFDVRVRELQKLAEDKSEAG